MLGRTSCCGFFVELVYVSGFRAPKSGDKTSSNHARCCAADAVFRVWLDHFGRSLARGKARFFVSLASLVVQTVQRFTRCTTDVCLAAICGIVDCCPEMTHSLSNQAADGISWSTFQNKEGGGRELTFRNFPDDQNNVNLLFLVMETKLRPTSHGTTTPL